jgi:hypothetical protein
MCLYLYMNDLSLQTTLAKVSYTVSRVNLMLLRIICLGLGVEVFTLGGSMDLQ